MSENPLHRTVLDADGVRIHTYTWEAEQPRALVHVLHGVGEHAQRYAPLARRLQDAGFTVVADDHRGHGATGVGHLGLGELGPRSIRGAIDAAETVSRAAHAAYPELPIVLLGHSWGSFMAQKIVARSGRHYAGLVLSGTSLALPGLTRQGNFNERWDADGAGGLEWLSRDESVQQAFEDDPWCFDVAEHPVWTFAESTAIAGFVPRSTGHDLPVLIQGGEHDAVGGSRGPRLLGRAYERWTGLSDVTVMLYPEARHEVYNEINRDEVLDDLVGWVTTRF
ncbi:alpha/beta hydrolase [Paraoerskovia marina]|uniref:alpha/beta hydrolase n=1 Tax=Paraoerskovia marina TaxID=545619 RepID=UPI000492A3D1|nr:alpha/beta hydrolase [Paraoerskovia marina]